MVEEINLSRNPCDTRPIVLMTGDEGRFGRLGEVRSCWCPKGVRPIVPHPQVRQYIYAYAAVAPQLGH